MECDELNIVSDLLRERNGIKMDGQIIVWRGSLCSQLSLYIYL